VKVEREEKEACTVSKNAGTYCAAANRGSVVSILSCKEKETEKERERERETSLSPENKSFYQHCTVIKVNKLSKLPHSHY